MILNNIFIYYNIVTLCMLVEGIYNYGFINLAKDLSGYNFIYLCTVKER